MLKFKWLITNALLRHGNEAKNQELLLFYLFIARIHPILPNLINSTPGSSVNFHLVDVFTKPCISSNNLINISYVLKDIQNFIFSLREVGTKERLWHFVIAHQYTATKPDSFSNVQIRKICFQKYNILSQCCLIKFHKVLRLFYDFRAFISTLRDYPS